MHHRLQEQHELPLPPMWRADKVHHCLQEQHRELSLCPCLLCGALTLCTIPCRNAIMRPLRKLAGRPPEGEHVNMSEAGSDGAPMESKVV